MNIPKQHNSNLKKRKSILNTQKLIGSALAMTALAVVGMGSARANINPTGAPVVTTAGGVSTFTYNVGVDAVQTVNSGDFFTFYDIAGLTGVTTSPANFSAIVSTYGPTATGATGTATPNDSTLPNLTFTYMGASPLIGPQSLGSFSFQSFFSGATTLQAFVGRATTQSTPPNKNANLTSYLGPTPTAVPEPASVIPFALGGLGLLGLIARKTRRTSGAAA